MWACWCTRPTRSSPPSSGSPVAPRLRPFPIASGLSPLVLILILTSYPPPPPVVYAGPWAISWRAGVAPVFISWALSPAVAAFSSALIFSACRLLLRARRSYELSLAALPFFVFATSGLNIWFSLAKGNVSRTASRHIGAWSPEKIEWVTAAAAGGCAVLAVCLLPLLHLRISRATLCLAIGAHGGTTSRPWNAKDPTPRPDDEEEAAAATVAASGGGPPSISSSSSSTSSSPKRTLNPLFLAPARSPGNDASFFSRSKALVVASSGPESHYCGRGGDDDIVLHASRADAPFCGPIGRAVASFRPRDLFSCVSYFLFHGIEADMGNKQAAAQASPRTKIPAFVRPLLALSPPPSHALTTSLAPCRRRGMASSRTTGKRRWRRSIPERRACLPPSRRWRPRASCSRTAPAWCGTFLFLCLFFYVFLTLNCVGCLRGRPAGRHLAGGQHRIAGGDRCLTDVGHSNPRVRANFRHRHLRVQADARRRHQTCAGCGIVLSFSDPNCFIPLFSPGRQWLCSPRRAALR